MKQNEIQEVLTEMVQAIQAMAKTIEDLKEKHSALAEMQLVQAEALKKIMKKC